MTNKKFFIFLGIIYTIILVVSFYYGEERNRYFSEQGFKLCDMGNHNEWKLECPEEKGIVQTSIDFFVGQ